MKGVWFSVCAVTLAAVGTVSVAPSIAQAAGLTRAEVLAEIAGYQTLGYRFTEAGYPQQALDATRTVAAWHATASAAPQRTDAGRH